MIKTKIQWCHSTVNAVMGCGGCELFPSTAVVLGKVEMALAGVPGWKHGASRADFARLIRDAYCRIEVPQRGHSKALTTTNLFHLRHAFVESVTARYGREAGRKADLAIEAAVTCYAARLHLNKARSITNPTRGINSGYAPVFEDVTQFPGRVWEIARARDLRGTTDPDKPWLTGCPRLIFVSDMGDAFSRDSDFAFLEEEVIAPIRSPQGQRHFWLWLTKRPERMARFGERIGGFPANVCAMTTLTGPDKLHRIDELRRVPASVRGLSVEPLRARIPAGDLDLREIDWLIAGGESGRLDAVHPFDLGWARELREACRRAGVAFFLKQLGRRPVGERRELRLNDSHGGNWSEWPEDLRLREVPGAFLASESCRGTPRGPEERILQHTRDPDVQARLLAFPRSGDVEHLDALL